MSFSDRIFRAILASLDLSTILLAHRIGLYAAMAPPSRDLVWFTPAEAAAAACIHERYARELLEAQAVSGIVVVQDETLEASLRRYALPVEHAQVLAQPGHDDDLMPMIRLAVAVARPMDELVEAYRTGGGVPYEVYDRQGGAVCAIADINRPIYEAHLGRAWLASVPRVHNLLSTKEHPRIADIGCGCGASTVAMAKAYPRATLDGFDIDHESIQQARDYAEAQGLASRCTFHCANVTTDAAAATAAYDLVIACECIHDMPDPVSVLAAMRRMCHASGAVIIIDDYAQDTFRTAAGPIEQLNYGMSVLHCLPVGMAQTPSKMTGTVMRPSTLRQYVLEAGFSGLDILPTDSDYFRMYQAQL